MRGHGHILYFSDRQEINVTQEITTYTRKTPSHDTKENERELQEHLFLPRYFSTETEIYILISIKIDIKQM